jgi:integrase
MAGAFRRSELAALRLEDLKFTNTGLRITIPKSKRDQEGAGQTIAISRRALHPAGHVAAPLAACGRARPARPLTGTARTSPVFLRLTRSDVPTTAAITDKTIARLVKTAAAAADLDPTLYSAHSLRAGFLTEAAARRANLFKMKDHSRHKSLDTVADYVRDAAMFDDHAGDGFL